jgi:uncharacterized protein YndB with AHSA1/START domain
MFKDRITVSAPAAEVWKVLEDPDRLPGWLPKCTAVLKESDGGMRRGFRFSLEREWKGDTRVGEVEVTDCQPGKRITWRETDRRQQGRVVVEEEFELVDRGERCVVKHGLDLSKSGLPFWVLMIMKAIHVMGRPVGKTGLMRLAELSVGGSRDGDAEETVRKGPVSFPG